jgi:uncharacterized ion transporter superfamily protein YfcC
VGDIRGHVPDVHGWRNGGALANTTLALLPLGMLLARGLGFDNTVGLGMIYLGAYAGFNVGWGNVFTVGIAHGIAELPEFSGFKARVLFHAVNLTLSFWLVAAYAMAFSL